MKISEKKGLRNPTGSEFHSSVFVLEEETSTTRQEIPRGQGQQAVQQSFWGFEELYGYPKRGRKTGPAILNSFRR